MPLLASWHHQLREEFRDLLSEAGDGLRPYTGAGPPDEGRPAPNADALAPHTPAPHTPAPHTPAPYAPDVARVRRAMADRDFTGALLPVSRQGRGLARREAQLLAEEAGKALLPGEVLDDLLAAPLVAALDPAGDTTAALLSGQVTARVCPLAMTASEPPAAGGSTAETCTDPSNGTPGSGAYRGAAAASPFRVAVDVPGPPPDLLVLVGTDTAHLGIAPLRDTGTGTTWHSRLGEERVTVRFTVRRDGGTQDGGAQDGGAQDHVPEEPAAPAEAGGEPAAQNPCALHPGTTTVLLRSAHLLGVGLTAVAAAARRARARRQFGAPVGHHQAVSQPLAAARSRLEGLRLSVAEQLLALDEREPGPDAFGRAAATADAVARTVRETALHCLQTHGASGLTSDSVPAVAYRRALLPSAPHITRQDHPSETGAGLAPGTGAQETSPARVRLPRVTGEAGEDPLRAIGRPRTAQGPALSRARSPWHRAPAGDPAATELTTPSGEDPASVSVHGMVESAARRWPDRVAVESGDTRTTYRELDERADRLAHELRARGLSPQSPVGVWGERSTATVVAVLAVLKAGGAYLPLHPDHPPERIEFMLRDSGAELVLAHGRPPALTSAGVTVVPLDGGGEEAPPDGRVGEPPGTARSPGPVPEPMPTPTPMPTSTAPSDLAYLIYTSGSTGLPKGVEVEHRNLTNRLAWDARAFPLTERDAVLQHTSLGFDISVWELFAPLVSGARLVLARAGADQDPRLLVRDLVDHRITVLACVPSLLDLLLEQRGPGLRDVAGLRYVFCGGETLSPELCRRFAAAGLGAGLHNFYGPTECTIDVTHWACATDPAGPDDGAGHDSAAHDGSVPIGRPLANVRVHVVDEYGMPVPPGFPGELWVGGAGIARGYRERPELTAENFVPDPFSDATGTSGTSGTTSAMGATGATDTRELTNTTRTSEATPPPNTPTPSGTPDTPAAPAGVLYRTGDMVRQDPNGVLLFGGRTDDQVKINGYRIELGEIRNQLERHPAVRTAVVRPVDERIAAYVVPADGRTPDAPELLRHLEERLPHYMVPAAVAFLEAVPSTPNGKVDVDALPPVSWHRPATGPTGPTGPDCRRDGQDAGEGASGGRAGGERAARNVEAALLDLAAQVLGCEEVRPEDDFFTLGGSSLQAARFLTRARRETGGDVPLEVFLASPSVRALATALAPASGGGRP
ncbi:non-ribosomal peptide synthetase [Streptomyces sp. TS71-3]|uniref:non-ribosomal peptide synthetase n=1 Tax=Streptomyces sp. TS71-3 TaxID=2733862 RepID=UPI001B049FE6|nr:non-ribosomal peptide synthetase [Streptomyces sp. TS71-3]GHJ41605.1 hypothetical protein Sm713_72140 [Streptomyces sp. TS71-3]